MNGSRRYTALATSLFLLFAGLVALVLAPTTAHADPLPPEPVDFSIKPGDTVTQTFTKTIVGSTEVKGNPETCRHDQVTSLTCDARRVKITRAAGYSLRVVLEWDAQAANINSVPDVDMYIFDGPTSSLDATQIGGAGSTMPEQAKFVPTQDSYDIVVQGFAGAIQSYKLTLYYTNGPSAPQTHVTPDIILTPHTSPYVKTYNTPLVGEDGAPVFYPEPATQFAPADCRTNPAYKPLCAVYRLKLNRNMKKGANNFVVVQLEWDATQLPDIAAVAAGLGLGYAPSLVMFLWDTPTHVMDRGAVGGQDSVLPQRIGFTATQDEYDLVVEVATGAVQNFKMTAYMTDELFSKPFEVLDPLTGQPVGSAPVGDGSAFGNILPDQSGGATPPTLALAPVGSDSQISNIGLGTTQQFDANGLQFGRDALRNTAATTKPPAAWVLVLMLGFVPFALLAGVVTVLRRRRNVLF